MSDEVSSVTVATVDPKAWAYMKWSMGWKGPAHRKTPDAFIAGWYAARIDDAESLAKDLAIKLAVRELEKMPRDRWFRDNADAVITNLLIGLGCEAVVKAWEECG